MEDRKAIVLLTTYSAISAGIAAALIVIGFVVYVRLAQLLGIDLPSTTTDYINAAGDFLTSLIVRTLAIARGDFAMTRLHIVTALAAFLAAFLGLLLQRRGEPAPQTRTWRRHLMAARLCLVLISISAVALLLLTQSWLRLRNVLQPANDTHGVQKFQHLPMVADSDAVQRMIVDAYKHQSSTLHDPVAKACFNPSTGDTAAHRQNLYAGMIAAAALLLCAVRVAPAGAAGASLRAIVISIAWAAVLVSLPLAYATLGRNFTYPLVQITQPGPQPVTYCGYLLAADAASVTVYDRPGGFRLRHIPREHLLIDELGTASPFQGCGTVPSDPEGFIPCETHFCSTR